MAQELRLPELGENIDLVEVSAVLVSPGDAIEKDQPVVEVETEKASLEVPAPFPGVVEQVHVSVGDKIGIGQPLLTIATTATRDDEAEESGEDAVAEARSASETGEVRPTGGDEVEKPGAPASIEPRPAGGSGEVIEFAKPELGDPAPAAPSVRKLARELGVDIDRVPGSGAAGRISVEDVKRYAKRLLTGGEGASTGSALLSGAPMPDFSRWGAVKTEPLSRIRRTTAENMANAWSTIPHVTQFDRADITELEALRKRFAERAAASGGKLTITAIALKAAAGALGIFPRFNASLDIERQQVVYKRYVNIGVAVDTERGLLVPVIRDVDRKNIVQIAADLSDLSARARDKKIAPEELRGACFTVTNLGGLGTTYFSPIVNWPEVAILGVGRAEIQATPRDGGFVPRLMLPLSLSYDHRWIDGADAARFLRWIAEALEQPILMSLEG